MTNFFVNKMYLFEWTAFFADCIRVGYLALRVWEDDGTLSLLIVNGGMEKRPI